MITNSTISDIYIDCFQCERNNQYKCSINQQTSPFDANFFELIQEKEGERETDSVRRAKGTNYIFIFLSRVRLCSVPIFFIYCESFTFLLVISVAFTLAVISLIILNVDNERRKLAILIPPSFGFSFRFRTQFSQSGVQNRRGKMTKSIASIVTHRSRYVSVVFTC